MPCSKQFTCYQLNGGLLCQSSVSSSTTCCLRRACSLHRDKTSEPSRTQMRTITKTQTWQRLHYKGLNGLLCYEASRRLRSSGENSPCVPRKKKKQGEAAFSLYAAHLWNKLPEYLKVWHNCQLIWIRALNIIVYCGLPISWIHKLISLRRYFGFFLASHLIISHANSCHHQWITCNLYMVLIVI